MPPEHWAYKHQSKDRFIAWAEHIGPHTKDQVGAFLINKTMKNRPFALSKDSSVSRLNMDPSD